MFESWQGQNCGGVIFSILTAFYVQHLSILSVWLFQISKKATSKQSSGFSFLCPATNNSKKLSSLDQISRNPRPIPRIPLPLHQRLPRLALEHHPRRHRRRTGRTTPTWGVRQRQRLRQARVCRQMGTCCRGKQVFNRDFLFLFSYFCCLHETVLFLSSDGPGMMTILVMKHLMHSGRGWGM